MAKWRKVSGPRQYSDRSGRDIDVGWAWTLERDGREATVSVDVAGGRLTSNELPEESRRAIQSRGWSAIVPYLDDDELPAEIMVSTGGVGPPTS